MAEDGGTSEGRESGIRWEDASLREPSVAKGAAAARARGLWNQQKPAAGRRVYGRQPLAQVGLG